MFACTTSVAWVSATGRVQGSGSGLYFWWIYFWVDDLPKYRIDCQPWITCYSELYFDIWIIAEPHNMCRQYPQKLGVVFSLLIRDIGRDQNRQHAECRWIQGFYFFSCACTSFLKIKMGLEAITAKKSSVEIMRSFNTLSEQVLVVGSLFPL